MSRLAVILGFFSILAGTQKILLQSREHRGPDCIFMSSKNENDTSGQAQSQAHLHSFFH
jgi:hypothetical protein